MAKGGESSVSIPEYNKPDATTFNVLGNTASYGDNSWTYSGMDQDTYNQITKIRSDLLKSLTGGSTPASNEYVNTLYNNILETAQPSLENSLIGRGLGGSSVYQGALTDLLSKAATQATLQGQQYNLNNLGALQNYLSGEQNYGLNLLNSATGYDVSQQQLAQQLYNMQLPYLATVNQGNDYSGLGSALGTGLGALLALPTGGMSLAAGAQLGGMLGGAAGGLF